MPLSDNISFLSFSVVCTERHGIFIYIFFSILGKDELAEWNMFVAITPPAYTERFNGMLDEFYIYNCSLTSEQIRDIADTCRSKGGTPMFLQRFQSVESNRIETDQTRLKNNRF